MRCSRRFPKGKSAAKVEREQMKADRLYGDGHHGHNVHYMATSYSFEGRYDDAVEAARELLGFKENPGQAAAVDTPRTAIPSCSHS